MNFQYFWKPSYMKVLIHRKKEMYDVFWIGQNLTKWKDT